MPSNEVSAARAARKAAGRPLEWVAVHAGVAVGTARVYELNPLAVSDESRAKLDPVYAQFPRPNAAA